MLNHQNYVLNASYYDDNGGYINEESKNENY